MRAVFLFAIALVLAIGADSAAHAPVAACTKGEFEAVVDEAAAALRALNQQNTPSFQARLRQLKDKRGWSHEQFLKEAAPYVRDDAIAGYDQKSEAFLERITSAGQSQTAAATPDCALLIELHGAMKALIETQREKWAYMFAKIDKELQK